MLNVLQKLDGVSRASETSRFASYFTRSGDRELTRLSNSGELPSSVAALNFEESSEKTTTVQTTSLPLDNKYPIPSEPHFGCVAKVYGDVAASIKTTDVYDFIGILTESSSVHTSCPTRPKLDYVMVLHVMLPGYRARSTISPQARQSRLRSLSQHCM